MGEALICEEGRRGEARGGESESLMLGWRNRGVAQEEIARTSGAATTAEEEKEGQQQTKRMRARPKLLQQQRVVLVEEDVDIVAGTTRRASARRARFLVDVNYSKGRHPPHPGGVGR